MLIVDKTVIKGTVIPKIKMNVAFCYSAGNEHNMSVTASDTSLMAYVYYGRTPGCVPKEVTCKTPCPQGVYFYNCYPTQ